MFCENCGTHNDEHAIICINCGEPLNIEKNVILEGSSFKHGTHVDIEDVSIKHNRDSIYLATKNIVFKIIVMLLLIGIFSLFLLGCYVVKSLNSKNLISEYNDLLSYDDLSIIYFGNNTEYDSLLERDSINYDLNYLNIPVNKLTISMKRKIYKDLGIKQLDDCIAIIDQGNMIDYIYVNDTKTINEFLTHHKVLPNVKENTSEILSLFDSSMNKEETTVIYLPSIFNDNIEQQNNILLDLCNEFSLNYINIHGYALSEKQLLRLYQRLGYSEVKSQLIILVQNKKVLGIIEDIKNNKQEYLNSFSNYNLIDSSNLKSIIAVDRNQLLDLLNDNSNHIIVIDQDKDKYSDRIINLLTEIMNQYSLDIYYFNLDINDSEMVNILVDKGLTSDISTFPFVMITEKGKILNFIIGLADKEYYIDQFTEYGLIR